MGTSDNSLKGGMPPQWCIWHPRYRILSLLPGSVITGRGSRLVWLKKNGLKTSLWLSEL